ncbi:MAG: carbon-nitrogen hydrolase family protein [Myxococcota bacterium]
MKVALAQLAPVFLNRDATLERVVAAIQEAAEGGASLVAFGEGLVPGYPVWLEPTEGARFESERQKRLFAHYVDQAVQVEGSDLDGVRAAARERELSVILGVIERDPRRGQSVFATLLHVDQTGTIVAHHRKLMPTYEERLVWSPGDAHGLRVHEVGPFRVGALNCWENWMPLPRAALYAQGETLHVAIWPGSRRNTEDITRFLAREGRSYVVSVGSLLRPEDVPENVPDRSLMVSEVADFFTDGGSCVASPTGEWVLEPCVGREALLFAELDPELVRKERQSFDPAGHYARPELLRLSVDRRRPGVDWLD